jgi:hypothetical protein
VHDWCVIYRCTGGRSRDTYICLIQLDAVDVGSSRGNKEAEASVYAGGTGGQEQVKREVGRHTCRLCACQGSLVVEGCLQEVCESEAG